MFKGWHNPLDLEGPEYTVKDLLNWMGWSGVSGMDVHYSDGYHFGTGWKDETHHFNHEHIMMTSTTDPVVKSKIRVTFNRPWTWSEREQFLTDLNDPENTGQFFSEGFTEKGKVLVIGSDTQGSRDLYEEVALYCELFLVNQHPVAVLTLFPKEVM